MKWRFQWLYRLGLAALFVGAGWSLWAQTTATNTPAADVSTNNAMALFKLNRTFGLDQVDFLREQKILHQPLWKYLEFLIFMALAFAAARLLNVLINGWLKRVTARTQTKYDDLILEFIRRPLEFAVFVILIFFGLGIFNWTPRAEIYLSRALLIVIAVVVTHLALKLVDLMLRVWREKISSPQDRVFASQLVPLISKCAKIAVVTGAVLLTTENLGMDIKTLLAGLSVGGLALGLAAQDTVANLFGAVAVFLDKPFYVGDRIKVDSVDGTVESIGLRSTRVRNLDGYLVTVPNKLMGNAVITNISRRPSIRTEMNFGLTYDTPNEKVKRATALLEEIFRANPKTSDLLVSFNKFTDSTLNIFVAHVWDGTDAKIYFAEMQEMNLQIKEKFAAEKIEFAFPTQTVHLKQ